MSVAGTVAVLTRFVARSFAPATATLPTAPRPSRRARFAFGMFLRLPSMNVPSTSTGPANGASFAFAQVSQMRCAKYQAVFWVTPRSRCGFR